MGSNVPTSNCHMRTTTWTIWKAQSKAGIVKGIRIGSHFLVVTFVEFHLLKGLEIDLNISWLQDLARCVSLLEKSGWAVSISPLLKDVSGYTHPTAWISSCQSDLIKKATFHISVFVKLCNCYCFSSACVLLHTPKNSAQQVLRNQSTGLLNLSAFV